MKSESFFNQSLIKARFRNKIRKQDSEEIFGSKIQVGSKIRKQDSEANGVRLRIIEHRCSIIYIDNL